MSYKIYAGTQSGVNTWETRACIYDPGSQSNTKKLISPTLTREFGKAGSLSFTVPLGNVAHSALQKLKTVISVEQDGEEIWKGRVMSHEQDFLLRQKVTCEGELAFLNDSSIAPYTATDVTIRQFLQFICSCHNANVDVYKAFSIGNVTIGSQRYAPLAQGCYLQLDYASGSPDDEGDYSFEYGLYLPSGARLVKSFEMHYTDDPDDPPETDAGKWEIGELHFQKDFAIWRTDENKFSVRINAVYQNGKTYQSTQTTVTGKITCADEKLSGTFPSTVKIDKTETRSSVYTIQQSGTGYQVLVNGSVSSDFEAEPIETLYSFGDGKNYGITWDILQNELVNVYGGYLISRNARISEDGQPLRFLDYVQDAVEYNQQGITFGTNLLDLTNYVKAEDIVTRVIAIGKKTSGWWIWSSTDTIQATANDETAQKLYGTITRYLIVDGTSSTLQSLQDEADMELGKHLRLVDGITVKAVDLKDAGVDVERIKFGRLTRIRSAPHGIDTWITCTKLVEPFDAPDKKEFTFGKKFSSISDLQALSARKATTAYDLSRTLKEYAVSVQAYSMQANEVNSNETV